MQEPNERHHPAEVLHGVRERVPPGPILGNAWEGKWADGETNKAVERKRETLRRSGYNPDLVPLEVPGSTYPIVEVCGAQNQ